MRRIPFALGVLILLGWTGSAEAPPAGPDMHVDGPRVLEVKMVDRGGGQWRFAPADIQVTPGDVVRFVQDDVAPHNVEFKDVPGGTTLGGAAMGPFLLQKGETYDLTIDDRFAPGLHKYVCTPHELLGMVGTIAVSASGS